MRGPGTGNSNPARWWAFGDRPMFMHVMPAYLAPIPAGVLSVVPLGGQWKGWQVKAGPLAVTLGRRAG